MLHGRMQRFLACVLVLCILAIGGFAAAQSLTHDVQHSHHQKATHGTVLCSWMCAAGQAGEVSTVLMPLHVVPQEFAEQSSTASIQSNFSCSFSTRAPPVR
ncbi:MAG TPA: hypothetical protein VLD60_10425 [Nitrospira sp.]|nr:hypothetical protein [Nitrospira sp.]